MAADEPFASVLAAARTGAEWALSELWRTHNPRLVAWLRAEVGDAADDVASETWIDVARSLVRFDGGAGDFRAWLWTIARRRVIDHRRAQGRRVRVVDLAEHDAAGGEDPGVVALAWAEADEVTSLLALLTPDQAEVVRLRVLAGLDVAEVATVLGKQPGAVRVLCHRALRRLAERVEPSRRPQGV